MPRQSIIGSLNDRHRAGSQSDHRQRQLFDRLKQLGFKALINARSKTWRELPATTREQLSGANARELILRFPTLIKRPLIDTGSTLLVGYDEDAWAELC